jgi:hypothetical protein
VSDGYAREGRRPKSCVTSH